METNEGFMYKMQKLVHSIDYHIGPISTLD